MQAHALTIRMPGAVDPPQSHQIEYPFMCLLVSGGHCILTWVKSVDEFIVFGHDIDGAPGEAFDKVRMTNCKSGELSNTSPSRSLAS